MNTNYYTLLSISLGMLFGSLSAYCQQVTFFDRSVHSVAMSQATVATPNPYSVFNNPGATGLLGYSSMTANAGFYYGLPELKHFQAGSNILFTTSDHILFTINHFGDPDFRESTIELGYSRQVNSRIGVGFKAAYSLQDIAEFGNQNGWSFSGGLLGKLTQRLFLGYQGRYVLKGSNRDLNPSFHHIGIHYQPIDKLTVSLSSSYFNGWSIQGGIHYYLIDDFWLKIGANSYEPSYSMGMGYQFKPHFAIEAAFQYHTYLGISPFMGVIYQFLKSKS